MTAELNNKIFTIESKRDNIYKFEEAITITGFGKYNHLMTLLNSLILLAIIMETIGVSYIIPAAQCDLKLTLAQKGWLAAIPFIGLVVAGQFWGYMADTKGRRKILMISMTLGSVCSMISSLSPNFIVFAILRFTSASLMAASNAVVFTYYGEFTPKTHVDMMISVLSSVILGSSCVSTAIAWVILMLDFNLPIEALGIDYRPWRLLVLCFAIPFILASIALYQAPESPKFLMSQGKEDEALKILSKMYSLNSGKHPSTFKVDKVILDDQDRVGYKTNNATVWESIRNQTFPIFKPPLLKYTLILFTISFGIYGCGNSFFMWLPDILDRFYVAVDEGDLEGKTFCNMMGVRSELHYTLALNSSDNSTICDDSFKPKTYPLMLLFTFLMTVSNLMIALILRWLSKKLVLLIVVGAAVVSTIAINFIRNQYIAWIFLLIYQVSEAIVGIVSAFGVELFPTQLRAMAVSLIMLIGRVGAVFGTSVGGILMEKDCTSYFYLFGATLIICFVCGIFLPRNITSNMKNNNSPDVILSASLDT